MKPVWILAASLTLGTTAFAADKEPMFNGKTKTEWVTALKEAKNVASTVDAVKALGRFADAGTAPALIAVVIRHEDTEVRLAAMDALRAIGPMALPHVIPLFRHPDEKVAGVGGLIAAGGGWTGRAAAVPAVHLLARPLPAAFRERVATWLVQVQSRDSVPALVEVLKSPDSVARRTAAHVLFHLETEVKAAVAAVADGLTDLPAGQRARAVLNLAPAGTAAVPVLVERLTDVEPVVRYTAARVLAKLGPAATLAADPLVKALAEEKDERVTGELAEAVWRVARGRAAIPAFGKLIGCHDDTVALAAAERLWRAGRDPRALAALKRLAVGADVDDEVAVPALSAIGDIGPPAASLAGDLVRLLGNPSRAPFAARALGRLGYRDKAVAARLGTLAAEEKFPLVRFVMVAAQAKVSGSEAVWKTLPALLNDAPATDRASVAGLLVALAPPTTEGLVVVRQLTASEHAVVRAFAADMLVRSGRAAEAVPVIQKLLDDPDPAAVVQAILSLGLCEQKGKPAVAKLCDLLWDERYAHLAAEALGRIGPAANDAVPRLIERLRADGPNDAYSSACEALAEIGPEALLAVPDLRAQLKSPFAYVRVHAARALWKVAADKSGEAVLTAGLTHHDYKCRGYAAETLWFMRKDKQAIPTLLRLLDDFGSERGNQRYIAARALGRIGPAAKAALPVLKRALDDADPMLVATATAAIKLIESK